MHIRRLHVRLEFRVFFLPSSNFYFLRRRESNPYGCKRARYYPFFRGVCDAAREAKAAADSRMLKTVKNNFYVGQFLRFLIFWCTAGSVFSRGCGRKWNKAFCVFFSNLRILNIFIF